MGGAALAGAVLAALGQAVPPLHLPTHESTQALCAFGLFVLPFVARPLYAARREGPERSRLALWDTVLAGAALGAGYAAVQALANALGPACRTQDAWMFFGVTWAPVVGVAAVLGVIAAERGWSVGRTGLMVVTVALASAAHDGLQYLAGVRIVDPILGDPLAFNQRIGMAVGALHLWQRLWLCSAGVALWALTRPPTQRRRVGSVVALAPLLLLTLGGGSHIGVGCSRHALHQVLDAEVETAHLRIRYPSRGRAARYIDAIARDGEWHVHRLLEAWDLELQHKVLVRVYDGGRDLGRLTGRPWPHGGFYQLDIPLWRTQTTTYPHELVHALHAELSYDPRLIWNRGMTEGTAVAFTEGLAESPDAHGKMAGALAAGRLPSAAQLMRPSGFHTVNEANAYDAAGSFLGFLVLAHGMEAFAELQRTFDWEGVYGADLPALDARWRSFLRDEVEVGLEQRARAREQFDPTLRPAYVDEQCPKLGSRRESKKDRADRLLSHGDAEAALDVYLELLVDQEHPRWALRAAACLDRLGREDAVIVLLDDLIEGGDWSEDQRYQLLDRNVRPLLVLRRFDALEATLAELRRLEPRVPPEHEALAALIADPELREPVARFFEQGSGRGRGSLLALVEEHPEDEALALLVATRASALPGDDRDLILDRRDRARIHEALGFLDRAPGACDALASDLLDLAHQAVRLRELDLADRLAARVARDCTRPERIRSAEAVRARVAWERSTPLPELTE